MRAELHYGKDLVFLEIPEANLEQVIRPWQAKEESSNEVWLRKALQNKNADSFQSEIDNKRLCVLIDDGTRDEPFDDMFQQLFGVLQSSSAVKFMVCTGTHDAKTVENNKITEQIIAAANKADIGSFSIHIHDYKQARFINAGQTSRGTQIHFNAEADDADVFLVLSDIKAHYFAGYSNPVKNFMPGICAFETAEQNHSLALDCNSTFGTHPWHLDQARTDNPLAEDELEGMQLIVKDRPVYALVTISTSGKIQWAQFGPADKVSSEAFAVCDQRNAHTVKPCPRLIVSPGGFPNDISLYIAQRALELTKNVVMDDGEILFIAACPNGIGEKQTMENFYNRLTIPIDQILKSITSDYKLFSHKPYKFAQLIHRLQRIWMYSQVPDDLIEAAHLHPTHHPQAIVDHWLTEDPNTKIIVVDGANKIALYAET